MCFTAVTDADLRERQEPARYRALVRHHGGSGSAAIVRAPSPVRSVRRVSRTVIEERRPPSIAPTRRIEPPSVAPSYRSASRAPSRARSTHYVEVEEHASSDGRSEIAVEEADDVRSRAPSHHSRRSSAAPRSEYSVHEREREVRREYGGRPRSEYETYQYVEAPDRRRRSGSLGRRSQYDDPRTSREIRIRMSQNAIPEDERSRYSGYR